MPNGEVVVVGGGLAGLMTAALLARGGARVRLVEASAAPGGRARSTRRDGFSLNQGAHAMFTGGAVERVLAKLDVRMRAGAVVPSHGRIMHKLRLHPFPAGPWSLLTSEIFDGRAKRELLAFLARTPKRDAIAEDATLRAFLDERFESDASKQFLEMLVRLTSFTNDPSTTSARDVVSHLAMTIRGKTLYLHDGWQGLVDDLHAALRAHGGRVSTGAPAVRVATSSGRASGVELEGGEALAAEAVVLAVPPAAAARLAPDAPEVRAAAEAAVPVRVACLDVGLASLPCPERTYVLGLEDPVYFSVHSRYASLAPPGASLAQLLRYLRPGQDASGATRELEHFLDFLQPGWQEELRVRQDLPEIVACSWWPRAGVARPLPAVASVPGLFLAGDWVGDEGLLAQASAASAEAAAALAGAHLRGARRARGALAA